MFRFAVLYLYSQKEAPIVDIRANYVQVIKGLNTSTRLLSTQADGMCDKYSEGGFTSSLFCTQSNFLSV